MGQDGVAVDFEICIQEIWYSNLGREAGFLVQRFYDFSQSLQTKSKFVS
jgi:hypothetical protein